uniref:Cytochrome P450 n=1 Tax=Steinernema glaseri TaxID=37863 RepID=A0A1I7Y626_9BILA
MFALLALFGFLFALVYGYFWNRSRFFQKRGIPGPKPTSVFSGNLLELQKDRSPFNGSFLKWEKEYGSTFGYLEGGQKVICTSDVDILADVFSRKFECFHSRKPIHPFPFNPDKDPRANVFTARGLRWKRLRNLTHPSFANSKLRMMQGTMKDTTIVLMRMLEGLEGKRINMCKWFLEAATDVIERIAFGKETSGIGKEPNPVTHLIRSFFNPAPFIQNPVINFYVGTFEFQDWTIYFHKVLIKIVGSPLTILGERLVKAIEKRRARGPPAAGDNNRDFIDLFLDSEAAHDEEKSHISKQNRDEMTKAHVKVDKKLTDQEIVSMCSVLMLAGVDTTATAMSILCYHLATHEDVQQKLVQEIDDFVGQEDDINMDNVNNMKYLDWCIKESLRIRPLAAGANSRICMKTCEVGPNNLLVEEGMTVVANVFSIHHNRELWGDDAGKYVPERWDPEADRIPKHPFAYQPFGAGPRTCMGQRFALLEMKLIFCHLLKKFSIEKCDKTKCNMSGIIVCAPSDVYVTLKRRSNLDSD